MYWKYEVQVRLEIIQIEIISASSRINTMILQSLTTFILTFFLVLNKKDIVVFSLNVQYDSIMHGLSHQVIAPILESTHGQHARCTIIYPKYYNGWVRHASHVLLSLYYCHFIFATLTFTDICFCRFIIYWTILLLYKNHETALEF